MPLAIRSATIISANADNDSITAGTGNDSLVGGSGNATLTISAGDGWTRSRTFTLAT